MSPSHHSRLISQTGVVIGESWIGTWVDPELREARMAALPLVGNWEDGAGRRQLRECSN